MPLRKTVFVNNHYFHVLNRGVAESFIFKSSRDYQRFTNLINFYRYNNLRLSFSRYTKLPSEQRVEFEKELYEKGKPSIEIYSYCLMPSHFHLQIKQITDNGIQKFMANIQNSYAKYYNIKNNRFGPLFQSRFKAKIILSDEIMLHISRYIHLNPISSYPVNSEELSSYQWSSLPVYLGVLESHYINTDLILKIIGGENKYKKFIYNQIDYQQKLIKIKNLLLEK